MLRDLDILDGILGEHADAIGGDMTAYRNHAYRVLNLAAAGREGDGEAVEKLAVAAAFHDLGIWTDHTFDYLRPSIALAMGWLEARGRTGWSGEIEGMIGMHHKITPYRGDAGVLVEPFRRADWADVSYGLVGSQAARRLRRELLSVFPDAGFHRLLVRLELRHLRRHPFNPLPVLRI